MENEFSDLTDREKWCLEKVDFITSVVENINREFVWAKIASCHSNKDVSKLLQRLLKDNGDSDHSDDDSDDDHIYLDKEGQRVTSHGYDNWNSTHQVKRYDSHKAYRHENDDSHDDYNRHRERQRISDHRLDSHNEGKRHDRKSEYRRENYDSDDDISRRRGNQRVSDNCHDNPSATRQVKRRDSHKEYCRENDDTDDEFNRPRESPRIRDSCHEKHQVTKGENYKENHHDGNYDHHNNYQGCSKYDGYHAYNHDDETNSINGKGTYGAVGCASRPPSSTKNTQHEDPEEDEDDIVIKIFNQVTSLTDIFPDVDPVYLQKRCWKAKADTKAYTRLVEELLQQKDQPPRSNEVNIPDIFVAHPSAQYNSTRPKEKEEDTVDDQEQECGICCDDVAAKDMVACNAKCNKHRFCRNCVKRFVEEEIGQGRSTFRCLDLECKGQISNGKLKGLLSDKVFERTMTRQQQEEIESAGIDDLLSCPFCDFMMILPDKKDIVFLCQNPECGRDSCRFCKEPNHCPQTCEEVKADKQKDARTMLENRMAEAMIRECFKCKKRFIKEAGCNLMTCSCGAKMCYQCKKTITGYDHFHKGQGGCVLHADATSIHIKEVKKAAEDAKKELDPNLQLVHDPTKSVL